MAKLPRGIITGAAPKERMISPGLAVAGHVAAAQAADSVSDMFLRVQQADDRTKVADTVSNVQQRLRDYVSKSSTLTFDDNTGRPAYELAVQDFEKVAKDLRAEALKVNASNPAKAAIEKQISELVADTRTSVERVAFSQWRNDARARAKVASERLQGLGEFAEARSLVEDATDLFSPGERAELLLDIDENQGKAAAEARFESVLQGFDQALAAGKGPEFIASIEAEPILQDRDEHERLLRQMVSKLEQAKRIDDLVNADARRQAETARGMRNLNLRESVRTGTAGKSEIRAAYARKDITIAEAGSMEREAEKVQSEIQELALVRQVFAQGFPGDPQNKVHRAAADMGFREAISQSPQGLYDPAVRTEVARQIEITNIVPDDLNSMFRSVMLKGEPRMQVALADIVDRIGPAAKIPKDAKAFARIVNDAVRGGMDAERAVEHASDWVFDTPESTKKALSDAYRAESEGNTNILDDYIDDNFDTAFSRQPDAPIEMQADFDSLARSYYQKTRDIDQARSLAFRDLRTQWGRTDVNGFPQMMRFPIEETHGSWAVEDLREEMKALGIDSYRVAANEKTIRTEGRWYQILQVEDGLEREIFVEIDGEGATAHYQVPDFSQTKQFQDQLKQLERQQAKIDEARAKGKQQALEAVENLDNERESDSIITGHARFTF